MAATLAGVAAGPALAKPYPPPKISLLCSAAANDATLEGTVCVLPRERPRRRPSLVCGQTPIPLQPSNE
jgi:hypothetical protein